jgi:hypothetical protein
MKTYVPMLIAFLCMSSVGRSQSFTDKVLSGAFFMTAEKQEHAGSAPSTPLLSPTTVEMKYWTASPTYFSWQLPRNFGSFLNLYLLQRFTLPNNGGFLDSMSVFIQDIAPSGAVLFRVWPTFPADLGGATYYLPQMGGTAIDSVLVDKAALKMNAFNSLRMRGALVPKEFYISVEFTFSGTTNNTVTVRGDNHDQAARSPEKSRVVMLNQASNQLQFALLDSTLVESGTGKAIFSYLMMSAFADTATFSPETKIVTTPPTSGYANVPYIYNLHAIGIPRPAYRLVSGPPNMTVEWYTGEVKWTPTNQDAGPHEVIVEAFNPNNTDRQTFSINVIAAATPKITSVAKKTAIVGEPYMYQVTATGGPTPTFTIASASLTGIAINATTGLVNFTPTAQNVGSHIVGITATNPIGSDQQTFTLTIASTASAPKIVTSPVITGTVGQKYTYQVSASGNPGPTFSLTKSPTGMTVDANSGIIEWTPTASGSYPVTVKAENRVAADSQSFSVAISSASSAPQWASNPKSAAVADRLYTDTLVAFGTPTPSYQLTSGPSGLVIEALTGKVTWTPTRDQKGPNSVQVRAMNSSGFADKTYAINVQAVPRITSTEVFTAKVNELYSYQVVADAEPAATFSLDVYPTGMTINSATGLISWTPNSTQKGQHQLKVLAVNPVGTDQQQFTIDVTGTSPIDRVADASLYVLGQNYPNPVVRSDNATTIAFSMPVTAHVVVDIVNVYGQVVSTVLDDMRTAGEHTLAFDTQVAGRALPAGQYMIRMTTGAVIRTRMMTILK